MIDNDRVDPELLNELADRLRHQTEEVAELGKTDPASAAMTAIFMKSFVKTFPLMPKPARDMIVRLVPETHEIIEDIMVKHRASKEKNDS